MWPRHAEVMTKDEFRHQKANGIVMKTLKSALKRLSIWLFNAGQLINIFILPVHYYVPLSSTRKLRRTRKHWNWPIDIAPIQLSTDLQRHVLTDWIAPYEPEYRGNRTYLDASNNQVAPGFGYIEAQALHGFIRKTRPRRMIEVGSGVSTWCTLAASRRNVTDGHDPCEIDCIEPHPSSSLKTLPVHIHERVVEDVELTFFDKLEANDLLFIDLSHAVRPCGDVAKLYLEILPRLKAGVFIHVHDVYFPYMFPRDIERSYTQSMETALLFALLAYSTRFKVLISLSVLHYNESSLLRTVFPEYDAQPSIGGLRGAGVRPFGDRRHFPSSTYLVVQ